MSSKEKQETQENESNDETIPESGEGSVDAGETQSDPGVETEEEGKGDKTTNKQEPNEEERAPEEDNIQPEKKRRTSTEADDNNENSDMGACLDKKETSSVGVTPMETGDSQGTEKGTQPSGVSAYTAGDFKSDEDEASGSWSEEEKPKTSWFPIFGGKGKKDAHQDKKQKEKKPEKAATRRTRRSPWGRWSEKDTEEYRNEYPGKKDYPKQKDNLNFYLNELKSYPDGDYIDIIHRKWYGDHRRLEQHHGYIQWIFPIRETGMNIQAQELQLHEAKAIINDKKAHTRVLKSYEMMLDFYGMEMKDTESGVITRAENWEARSRHLNRSFHNYLRITRILKSLGEFGYERLKYPFCDFVIKEAFEENTLSNCAESCAKYWIHTLRVEKERQELVERVESYYD